MLRAKDMGAMNCTRFFQPMQVGKCHRHLYITVMVSKDETLPMEISKSPQIFMSTLTSFENSHFIFLIFFFFEIKSHNVPLARL